MIRRVTLTILQQESLFKRAGHIEHTRVLLTELLIQYEIQRITNTLVATRSKEALVFSDEGKSDNRET